MTDVGDRIEALIPIAARLIGAVHDDGTIAIAHTLAEVDAVDVPLLLVILAASCDPDRSMEEALAWVTWDEHGRPLSGPRTRPARPRRLIVEPPPERVTGEPCHWDERTVTDCHALVARAKDRGEQPSPVAVAGEREYQRRRAIRRRRKASGFPAC